jgi:hypothetical protein
VRLIGRYQFSRQSAVSSDAAVFTASPFRDMKGIGKLSSVKAGTPSTVVMNRQNFHLNPRILGYMRSGGIPSGAAGIGNRMKQYALK